MQRAATMIRFPLCLLLLQRVCCSSDCAAEGDFDASLFQLPRADACRPNSVALEGSEASLLQLPRVAATPRDGDVTVPLVVNISDWQHIHSGVPNALLGITSSRVIVTATNSAGSAIENLRGVAGAQLVVLQTGPKWPGNLMKLAAFKAAAAALPAKIVVMFTDCCDVWFRFGGGVPNIFSRFVALVSPDADGALAGKEVVISAERGVGMLGHAGTFTDFARPHDHHPSELPSNPYETELGVADTCAPRTAKFPRCLQSKMANSGLVIGFASALHRLLNNTWNVCDQCRQWDLSRGSSSLQGASDQNQLTHYLLTEPIFDGGRCAIDYHMSLFHTTTGYVAQDYEYRNGSLRLTLPGGAQVELLASVVHIPSSPDAAAIVSKLRGPNSTYSKFH